MSKIGAILICMLSLVCAFLAIKTSNDSLLPLVEGSFFQSWFTKFQVGNEIIFNISLGFLVSVIFYILVVWVPYRQKRRLIKNNYKKQYDAFKEGMIIVFLSACKLSWNSELINKLKDQSEFKTYFKEPVTDSQDRWDVVLNGLDEYLLKDLIMELELFLNETNYVRNNIEFSDKQVFEFFNELERSVYRIKGSSLEYEDVKAISQFIWHVFTGWSWSEGYRKPDIIQEMIGSI